MTDFINTIDILGDDVVADDIIDGSIAEYHDDQITNIGEYAFYKCNALSSINFPMTTRISSRAFADCTALSSINLPTVENIETSAFNGCTALSSINLPAAHGLFSRAFQNCSGLISADFPTFISTIFEYTFSGCNVLKTLILRGTTKVSFLQNTNAFNSTPIASGTGYIYVPSALYDSYVTDSNWSTYSSQFRKLEEWTVDGTTTGELDLVNRHMVRFFNSDGTLLGYQIVATGEDANYDGTPVYPEDASVPFSGFEPQPIGVTADIDCYAQYISFATASWAKIAEISESGKASEYFNIGDTKIINCNGNSIKVEIAAFSEDSLADNSGKAGITIITTSVYPSAVAYDTSSTKKSWSECSFRTYCNNTIYSGMDEDLRVYIKEVTKHSLNGQSGGDVELTNDYCWALSQKEVGGNGMWSSFTSPVYNQIFIDDESRKRNGVLWNLRDFHSDNLRYYVSNLGSVTYGTGIKTARYFLFGFCI